MCTYLRAAEGEQVSEPLTQEGQSCPTGREGNLVRGSKIRSLHSSQNHPPVTDLDSMVHVEGKEQAVDCVCVCGNLRYAKALGDSIWDMDSQSSSDKNPDVGAHKAVGKRTADIWTAEDTIC